MKDWGPEGYCKHCNRMVAIAREDDVLRSHTTGHGPAETTCVGSETAPTKRVPKESRNHRFSYTPKKPGRIAGLRNHLGERGF